MSSEKIRKFERFLFKGDPTVMNNGDRNINRSRIEIKQEDVIVVGTYYYDHEKGTETYVPNKKLVKPKK